jgi:hypothetical protein
MRFCKFATALAAALLASSALHAATQKSVTVTVDTRAPGAEISPLALGLSYETSLLLPDKKGAHYFRPANRPLVQMFRTLGIRSLRIGGNSVDATNFAVPSETDVRSLFEFARTAGVKVIYSVRLQDGDAASAAKIAKLIRDHYADTLDCFAIGNEPSYYKDYAIYTNQWTTIRDAMLAVFPAATFCGPDQNPSPELCAKMVRDFGGAGGHLAKISQHSYSFGCSYKNYKEKDVTKLIPQDAAAAREKMLAPDAVGIYEKIRAGMADAVAGTAVGFRLSEVNSYWFSGLEGASDRYASALWGADYLHWWTARGADGLNFHTGDRTGGAIVLPCRYAAFVTDGHGYEARPLAYGLKLFELGGCGKILPVNISSAPEQNLTAYAALTGDQMICLTLINQSHGPGATNTEVQIKLDTPVAKSGAKIIFLTARHDDIAGVSADVTLGGARIKKNGSWPGRWTTLPVSTASDGLIFVTMPPASAAVIQVKTACPKVP